MGTTVGAKAAQDFTVLSADATVAAAIEKLAGSSWAVVTNRDGLAVGVIAAADLRKQPPKMPLGSLLRSAPPLVVAASDASPEAAVGSPELRQLDPRQPVLVVSGTQVVGVWAGEDLALTRLAHGWTRSIGGAALNGDPQIAEIRRLCRYAEGALDCLAAQTFAELPDDLPACTNPRGLTPHPFVW